MPGIIDGQFKVTYGFTVTIASGTNVLGTGTAQKDGYYSKLNIHNRSGNSAIIIYGKYQQGTIRFAEIPAGSSLPIPDASPKDWYVSGTTDNVIDISCCELKA